MEPILRRIWISVTTQTYRSLASIFCPSRAKAGYRPQGDFQADGGAPGSLIDCSDLQGVPRGPLGPGRFLFRGQMFWQVLLPEQVATNQLEFRIGMGEDKTNYARYPNDVYGKDDAPLADDDPRLIAAAVVSEAREDESDVIVALRASASWGDHLRLRRLLAKCFVGEGTCRSALVEAASLGHELVVGELLRARAEPTAFDDSTRKSALHVACEQGHESLARVLLGANADLNALDARGRSPCDLARDQDLGMMAKRLEALHG